MLIIIVKNIKKGVRNLRFLTTLVPRRHVTAICLTLRQLALYNCHLPLFPTNILVTYYSTYNLQISAIAFFTIFTRCITVNKSVFNLAIYRYAPNTNKVSTRLFGPVVLLKALNTIYKAAFLLILSSLTTIIW